VGDSVHEPADATHAGGEPAREPSAAYQPAGSAAEERLRLALDAGEMGAWEWLVPEGRVLWSERLERIHGLEPGAFGGTFEAYQHDIHPDDRTLVLETVKRTLSGEPHRLRYRIIRPDGEVRWLEARATLLLDAAGAPHRVIGICSDITERERAAEEAEAQQAELELQTEELQSLNEELQGSNDALMEARRVAEEAEHYVSGILGAIADPFVVHDRDWRFRYVNEPAVRELAHSQVGSDSVVGQVVWDIYPDLVGTRFEREMRRAQSERVPVVFEEFYAPRATWSEQRCYPLPDGGMATIWKDITERKRMEERLHYVSHASAILSSSLDYHATVARLARLLVPKLADWCGVTLLDDHGVLQQLAVAHVDPAKVEWARELSRRYPQDMSSPTGAPNVVRTGKTELYVDITDEMLQRAAVDAGHLQMMRELGMTSVLIVPLRARGRVIGVMSLVAAESGRRYTEAEQSLAENLAERAAMAIDNARLYTQTEAARVDLEESREELKVSIEELSRTNDELEAKTRLAEQSRADAEGANRAKAEFLAHMSHELRTPLNAIAGYSELMELGLHGPVTPEQREDLARIKRSQRHLLGLINDVLNFAKLEAAHIRFDIQPMPVRDAVLALEALIAPQLAAKSLRYECGEADPALLAMADSEKVQQILLNLLSNAMKFTEPGGRIAVAARRVATTIHIDVTDTGSGIPTDKRESVFEPFVQLARTLSSGHEGTGLGLAISRDLARAMGGELAVASTVGEGSTFTLVLPIADS
jgi:PAS domain S-box-containing protein